MKNINNLIQEKLNLNKQSKIEKEPNKLSINLFSEIQNEIGKGGEYHTYEFTSGTKKYKKGFVYIHQSSDGMGIMAYNDIGDFTESLGWETGDFIDIDDLDVNETCDGVDDCIYIRLW